MDLVRTWRRISGNSGDGDGDGDGEERTGLDWSHCLTNLQVLCF